MRGVAVLRGGALVVARAVGLREVAVAELRAVVARPMLRAGGGGGADRRAAGTVAALGGFALGVARAGGLRVAHAGARGLADFIVDAIGSGHARREAAPVDAGVAATAL